MVVHAFDLVRGALGISLDCPARANQRNAMAYLVPLKLNPGLEVLSLSGDVLRDKLGLYGERMFKMREKYFLEATGKKSAREKERHRDHEEIAGGQFFRER